jgi:hypothetical protein
MSVNTTTPSPSPKRLSVIHDLTDDHINFIKDFQVHFDTFHTSPEASNYGAQISWVHKNIVGALQAEFGPVSKDFTLVCHHVVIL